MAVPTEQELIDLKNAIQQLQQAQVDSWIHNLMLVLVGAFAGAIPTITTAALSNRWSQKLFFLSKDKDESVIKSKLYGEIRLTEGQLIQTANKAILDTIWLLYHTYRSAKCPNDLKVKEQEEMQKYNAKEITDPYIQKKFDFIRIVSEYNHFAKDKKLEGLLYELESKTLIDPSFLENLSYQELIDKQTSFLIFQKNLEFYEDYKTRVKAVINHILSSE